MGRNGQSGSQSNGSSLDAKDELRLIDLFAGAGGMTLGFCRLSALAAKSVWAIDNNADAVRTYRANFGMHCDCGDIVDQLEDERFQVPSADIVIGGPPCQGFSLLNKNRADDPRKQMWRPYMEVVRRSGARVFVIENVPQLLCTPEHEAIEAAASDLGFTCWSGKLLAANYGVPQTRTRAFIVGCRVKDPRLFFPPPRTHYDPRVVNRSSQYAADPLAPGARPWVTVREAIADLPAPVGADVRQVAAPFDLHFGRRPTEMSEMRYRAIPEEGMNRFDLQALAPELTPSCWVRKTSGGTDLFGRLWWDRPAFTIRTEFFKPEKGRYLHPQQHRPITHREAARFQSFPDWFRFVGSKIEIARQIGNAVPPLLAAAVANQVRLLLEERVATSEGVMG